MRFFLLHLLILIGFAGFSQNENTYEKFINALEKDIVFNEYISDEERIQKIDQLIKSAKEESFDKQDNLIRYAQLNRNLTKNKNDYDQSLYDYVELTETCDTTNPNDLRVYLGCLLQISYILRESSAFELSLEYIENGIDIIENRKLKTYPWTQDFYNDAGVDLLSLGEYERCHSALKKALSCGGKKDHVQDAMIEFNFSFLYYELDNLDSAIIHQKNTCSELEKIESIQSYPAIYIRYGNSLGSLSIFYFLNNNHEKAEEYALKAKSVLDATNLFDSGRYPHLFTLISLAIKSKNAPKIKSHLEEIKQIAEKVDQGRFNFYLLLSDSYKEIGNTEQETRFLNLAYTRAQEENGSLVSKLQNYNTKLQSQILQREKIRFQKEKQELSANAARVTLIVSLVLITISTVLYILYIRLRTKKNLLEKEKEISRIELSKNEIKSKLDESELSEKRLVMTRLASHIKLKQQTESAFLQKIKELKRNKPQNIEAEISELQVKMINLISMDQNFDYLLHEKDLDQEFKTKLKNSHPELTEKELQFCAYLLLGLSTKEISSITNKSDGATRVYKTRLKNKLILEDEAELTEYLQKILESNN